MDPIDFTINAFQLGMGRSFRGYLKWPYLVGPARYDDIVMSLPKNKIFIFELLELTLLMTSWCPFKEVVPLKTNCLAGSSLSKVMKQKFLGASSRNLSTGRITSTTNPNLKTTFQN